MTRTLLSLVFVYVLAALQPAPQAQVVRLDLTQMLEQTDDCVFGRIEARRVLRIDHPVDGPGLYFTTLTVVGRSLVSEEDVRVDVTYAGGFVDERNGVFNSEAPSEDEVRLGTEVVVFHGWSSNLGGDLAGQALWGSHGGLYPCRTNRAGETIVLGRGVGYPIDANTSLESLASEVREQRR